MPQQPSHPTPEELSAFSLGQLRPDAAAVVESHISDCRPCCETLLGLSSGDTFVALLQEARQTEDVPTFDQHGQADRSPPPPGVPAELIEHPRYEILGLIGRGGMGDVFQARHRMMDRTVALKVINRDLVRSAEAVERFHREVKTAARLVHPNIVTAYDAEQAGEAHFLVMEHVDGIDMARLIADEGPLPVAEACDYIRQAALGLQHAHEHGMVHRDIKPHNLMLTASGQIKILDFGLANFVSEGFDTSGGDERSHAEADAAALTHAGAMMGTPDYVAPEQIRDAHSADIRADVYSLGCTLYFLLTGCTPFREGSALDKVRAQAQREPQPVSDFRDDVPSELLDVLKRMTAKDPAERYQTPQELAAILEAILERLVDAQVNARLKKTGHPFDSTPPSDGGGQSRFLRSREPSLLRLGVIAACALLYSVAALLFLLCGYLTAVGEMRDDDWAVLAPIALAVAAVSGVTALVLSPSLVAGRGRAAPGTVAHRIGMLGLLLFPWTLLDAVIFVVVWRSLLAAGGAAPWRAGWWEVLGHGIAWSAPLFVVANLLVYLRLTAPANEGRLKTALPSLEKAGRRRVAIGSGLLGIIVCLGVVIYLATNRGTVVIRTEGVGGVQVVIKQDERQVRIIDADGGRDAIPVRLPVGEYEIEIVGRDSTLELSHNYVNVFRGGKLVVQVRQVSGPGLIGSRESPREGAPDVPTLAFSELRLFRQLEGHSGAVQAIELTPDGSRLISAGAGEILVRDTATWDVVRTIKTERLRTRAIAASPDGERLASGGQDGWLEIWDLESGRQLAQLDLGHGWIEYMDWSPDGKSIVLKCRDAGAYLVWDVATRQIVRSFAESGQAFVFSPDGKWLAAGERLHGAVKIFDSATGGVRLRLVHHARKDRVRALAFSPDGRMVLTGADDGLAKLWSVETGDLLETFQHDGGVHAAAFLPDNRHIVTGSKETRSLHLWSVTGRLVGEASDVEVGERGMAVSPDGRQIITALPHFQLPAEPAAPGVIQIWRLLK